MDDFLATGIALDLVRRRQSMLVRSVGFVSLVAVVITLVAIALDGGAFMHLR